MRKHNFYPKKKPTMKLPVLTLAVVFLFFLSGCATTKFPHTYRLEGKEYRDFKSLDDEAALKAVVMTYNVPVEPGPEETAKALTLQVQMELLEKRRTEYIKASGVFEKIKFEKIDLKIWSEEDLLSVYNELRGRFTAFQGLKEISEEQNAKKIIYLVGMQSLVNELEKRENTRQAWRVAAQLISTALSVAVSLI